MTRYSIEFKEAYYGYPEAIVARLNGVLPGIVDNATRAQNRIARTFAKPQGEDDNLAS